MWPLAYPRNFQIRLFLSRTIIKCVLPADPVVLHVIYLKICCFKNCLMAILKETTIFEFHVLWLLKRHITWNSHLLIFASAKVVVKWLRPMSILGSHWSVAWPNWQNLPYYWSTQISHRSLPQAHISSVETPYARSWFSLMFKIFIVRDFYYVLFVKWSDVYKCV